MKWVIKFLGAREFNFFDLLVVAFLVPAMFSSLPWYAATLLLLCLVIASVLIQRVADDL